MKAFANDKLKSVQMMISAFEKVENIVGKGENAGHQHFLLFLQCFQGDLPSGSLEPRVAWQRVKFVVLKA